MPLRGVHFYFKLLANVEIMLTLSTLNINLKNDIMKLAKRVLLVLFAAFMLAACGGSSPESAATKFLNAMETLDIETAKKYSVKEIGDRLDRQRDYYSDEEFEAEKKEMEAEAKKAKMQAVGSKIDDSGEKATVTFEMTGEDGERETHDVYLIKEDGAWKVSGFGS